MPYETVFVDSADATEPSFLRAADITTWLPTTYGQSLITDGNYVVQWSQQVDYRRWEATPVASSQPIYGVSEQTLLAYQASLLAQQANRDQYLQAALGAPAQRSNTVHYGRGGRGPELYTDCEPEDL